MSIKLPDEGTHPALAVSCEIDGRRQYVQFGRTATGKIEVGMLFRITEGPCTGMTARWRGYFTDAGTRIAVKALRTCGFVGDDLSQALVQELNKPVSIVIEHQSYKDKVYAEVKWVNSPRAQPKQMDLSELRSISEELKGQLAAIQLDEPAPDDIPF